MKLLIIGATRGIGKQLLNQALDANHTVTVLARKPQDITISSDNLTLVQGDIRDSAPVNSAIQGQDAVIVTIGVPITFKKVTLFSEGIIQVIQGMQEHGVKRLICVTGIGAGNSKGHGGFLYDCIFKPLFLRTIYRDKDIQERYITESGMQWVIVRPAGLTNGPASGKYNVYTELSGITSKRISRADVADFILKELREDQYSGNSLLLTY